MRKKQKRIIYQFLGFSVPLLTLISPSWLSIAGVAPRWAELWLLPWALEEGPLSGILGGFCLGILLDSINLAGSTQIPSLMILGFWWGLLGKKKEFTYQIFSLGLLAWLGSLFSGLLIWFQHLFHVKGSAIFLFNTWAFHTVFSAALITALIAPLLCSWTLRFFFKENPK